MSTRENIRLIARASLTPPPHACISMRIIKYKTLRSGFCHFCPYCLYEVIQHYNAKKEEEKIIGTHQGLDPGPPVP